MSNCFNVSCNLVASGQSPAVAAPPPLPSAHAVSGGVEGGGVAEMVRPARVTCFGDSLTQCGSRVSEDAGGVGWVALLQEALERKADVVNRGYSGYTSTMALAVAPLVLGTGFSGAENGTHVLTILLGTNDATAAGNSQHVDVDEYKRNLTDIVRLVLSQGAADAVLLITPPGVCDAMLANANERSNARVRPYARACAEVASMTEWAEGRVVCVDLHAQTASPSNAEFFSDGIHLSGRGNALVASLVLERIWRMIPDQRDLPNWDALVGLSPDEVKRAAQAHHEANKRAE